MFKRLLKLSEWMGHASNIWTVVGWFGLPTLLLALGGWAVTFFSSAVEGWSPTAVWVASVGVGALLAVIYAAVMIGLAARSRGKFGNQVGMATQDQHSSFRVALAESPAGIGDYEVLIAICITNTASTDLESRCLVSLEEFSGTWPRDMPKPLVLRTDGQIRGQRSGRFTLSRGQTKIVPLLYRRPMRKNEWYFLDENARKYFVPAGSKRIVLRGYGGLEPITALLFIDTDGSWNVFPRLDIVAANFTLRSAALRAVN